MCERTGWNSHRRLLLCGLREALVLLAQAGCQRVWLNGSFVTAKEEPRDFDCTWSTAGVNLFVLRRRAPELLVTTRSRRPSRFGGDIFPNVVELESGVSFEQFFQMSRGGIAKGVLAIDVAKEDWA